MDINSRQIFLLNDNTLVNIGFRLMLSDIHSNIAVIDSDKFSQRQLYDLECPNLIIIPCDCEDRKNNSNILSIIRSYYKSSIPSLYLTLDCDNVFSNENSQLDIIINPGNIKPSVLRNLLVEILSNPFLVGI